MDLWVDARSRKDNRDPRDNRELSEQGIDLYPPLQLIIPPGICPSDLMGWSKLPLGGRLSTNAISINSMTSIAGASQK